MSENTSIKRPKRLLYLTAEFSNNPNINLEQVLRDIYTSKLPLVKQRVASFDGKEWIGTYFQDREKSFCFQFSATVPGDHATIVRTGNLDDLAVPLDRAKAPQGFDFSDGDAICLVSKNNIFACFSQITYHKIKPFISSLIKIAQFDEQKYSIEIHKPADINKIAMIKRSGVRSIVLSESLTNADFSLLSSKNSIISKVITALFAKDPKLVNNAKLAKSRFKVSLTGGRGVQKWLSDEAISAIDEEDQYRIETKDGNVITPSMITISKFAELEPFGKSVFIQEAIEKLEVFKNDILKE